MDIRKNALEVIRVGAKEYRGKALVDVRLWVDPDMTGELIPTKKGVTFRRELLPEIVAALESLREPDKAA